MNHREPPPSLAGTRRALRCISLLLLPGLAPDAAPALPPPRQIQRPGSDRREGDSAPYLAFVGAPPLRFQDVSPPPDIAARPAAGAPPIPPLSPTESAVALANAAAARSAAASAHAQDEVPVVEVKVAPKGPAAPPKPTPPAILPDDTRPAVRPEDFLPYFQIPGAPKPSGEVDVIMPANPAPPAAPGTVQPSSASYTQSPK